MLTEDRKKLVNAANYHARVFEQNEVTYPKTMIDESTVIKFKISPGPQISPFIMTHFING